jgi:hypothetical protein
MQTMHLYKAVWPIVVATLLILAVETLPNERGERVPDIFPNSHTDR